MSDKTTDIEATKEHRAIMQVFWDDNGHLSLRFVTSNGIRVTQRFSVHPGETRMLTEAFKGEAYRGVEVREATGL